MPKRRPPIFDPEGNLLLTDTVALVPLARAWSARAARTEQLLRAAHDARRSGEVTALRRLRNAHRAHAHRLLEEAIDRGVPGAHVDYVEAMAPTDMSRALAVALTAPDDVRKDALAAVGRVLQTDATVQVGKQTYGRGDVLDLAADLGDEPSALARAVLRSEELEMAMFHARHDPPARGEEPGTISRQDEEILALQDALRSDLRRHEPLFVEAIERFDPTAPGADERVDALTQKLQVLKRFAPHPAAPEEMLTEVVRAASGRETLAPEDPELKLIGFRARQAWGTKFVGERTKGPDGKTRRTLDGPAMFASASASGDPAILHAAAEIFTMAGMAQPEVLDSAERLVTLAREAGDRSAWRTWLERLDRAAEASRAAQLPRTAIAQAAERAAERSLEEGDLGALVPASRILRANGEANRAEWMLDRALAADVPEAIEEHDEQVMGTFVDRIGSAGSVDELTQVLHETKSSLRAPRDLYDAMLHDLAARAANTLPGGQEAASVLSADALAAACRAARSGDALGAMTLAKILTEAQEIDAAAGTTAMGVVADVGQALVAEGLGDCAEALAEALEMQSMEAPRTVQDVLAAVGMVDDDSEAPNTVRGVADRLRRQIWEASKDDPRAARRYVDYVSRSPTGDPGDVIAEIVADPDHPTWQKDPVLVRTAAEHGAITPDEADTAFGTLVASDPAQRDETEQHWAGTLAARADLPQPMHPARAMIDARLKRRERPDITTEVLTSRSTDVGVPPPAPEAPVIEELSPDVLDEPGSASRPIGLDDRLGTGETGLDDSGPEPEGGPSDLDFDP